MLFRICNLFTVNMQNKLTEEIVFYMKGADSVMERIVEYCDWLQEEVCHTMCIVCHGVYCIMCILVCVSHV